MSCQVALWVCKNINVNGYLESENVMSTFSLVLAARLEKLKEKGKDVTRPHFYIIEILFNLKFHHRHNCKQDI